MWFEALTGFSEESPEQVRENIIVDGSELISRVNGRRLTWGELETPSLAELRERARLSQRSAGKTTVREVVADVRELHKDECNAHSLFQVASQFNLLEMVSPSITPERGVGIYDNDRTQGPACAIACGAGTIYRNYFANANGKIGQSASNQIDCLSDLGVALGNSDGRLWQMRNGYALSPESGLIEIADRLRASTESDRDRLRALLRIGIQWNTQVILDDCRHLFDKHIKTLPKAEQKLFKLGRHPSQRHEFAADAEPYADKLRSHLHQLDCHVIHVRVGFYHCDRVVLSVDLADSDAGKLQSLPWLFAGFEVKYAVETQLEKAT